MSSAIKRVIRYGSPFFFRRKVIESIAISALILFFKPELFSALKTKPIKKAPQIN